MNFIQSVKTCFRKYANFKGRATRSEFWWFQLFLLLANIASGIFDGFVLNYPYEADFTPTIILCDVVLLLPAAAVLARRLHDVGLSGWFEAPLFSLYLSNLAPFLPWIVWMVPAYRYTLLALMGALLLYWLWILYTCLKDSQPKTNKYGPNPKSPDMGDVFG